jgi:hypothetical protein
MSDLIYSVASVAATLSGIAIVWFVVVRPRLMERTPPRVVALLFLVIPAAMLLAFSAQFIADARTEYLVMAIIGLTGSLWISVVLFRMFSRSGTA